MDMRRKRILVRSLWGRGCWGWRWRSCMIDDFILLHLDGVEGQWGRKFRMTKDYWLRSKISPTMKVDSRILKES